MTAAGNLFNAKVDLKKFAGSAQHAQRLSQHFRPNAVSGQGNDGIGLFHSSVRKRLNIRE